MKRNIFKFLSAAALVGVTTLSLTSCKVVDTIKGWFDDDPVETTKPEENTPPATTDGDVIVDGTAVQQGSSVDLAKQVIFKKMSVRTALTVRATITPANATNKTLNWSLAWKNSNLENLSDYIIITPSADTLSCAITVKKGFNTPINLTVSAQGITKTCQLDFMKQVASYQYTSSLIGAENNTQNTSYSSVKYVFGNNDVIYSEYENLDSTQGDSVFMWNALNNAVTNYHQNTLQLEGDIYPVSTDNLEVVGTIGEVRTYNNDNTDFYQGSGYYTISLSDTAKSALSDAGYFSYVVDYCNEVGSSIDINLFNTVFNTKNMTSSTADKIIDVLRTVQDDLIKISMVFKTVYNDEVVNNIHFEYGFNMSISSYVPISNITLDNSNIIIN